MKDSLKKTIGDEDGSVMVAALLILVTLTIVGIWAMGTTTTEFQIATNDQAQKMVFTDADSGVYAIPKLISKSINESTPQDEAVMGWFGFAWLNGTDADTLYGQILGFDDWDGGVSDVGLTNTVYGQGIAVDIRRTRQRSGAGSGVEFASGAEGIGAGSAGSVHIFYGVDAIGTGTGQGAANVLAEYRKVMGIPGGL